MPQQSKVPEWRRAISSVAAVLAQGILLALVLIAPWLLGGVLPEVQIGLLAAVALATLCWLVRQLAEPSAEAFLPAAFIPMALVIGLGLLQLVPLDRKTNAFLSPCGDRLHAAMIFTEPPVEVSVRESLGVAAISQRQPLSLYPASTRHDLALLSLAVAVFFLGANLFHAPRAQFWLCSLLAVNGAALAFFGFVQQITWNGRIYWNIPLLAGGAPFGPFVCRNNAGGFLNLCLAGAAAMMIRLLGQHGSGDLAGGTSSAHEQQGPQRRMGDRLRAFVLHLNAASLAAMTLTVCIVAGIFCSLSRGAFLAMIGATVLTVAVTFCARRRIAGGWYFALIAAAGLGLVSWVGMSDAMKSRLATLLNQDALEQARMPNWKDALKAVPDFWRLGSGLGTYRYVYGSYQQRLAEVWYYHAENQYLETLIECGVPGLALLLTTIVLVAIAGWRLLRDAGGGRRRAFAIAGIFALTSQAIANFFDLGLYTPSNMLLLALFCGALCGGALSGGAPSRGAADLAERAGGSRLGRLLRQVLAPLVGVALLTACVFGLVEIRSLAIVQAALRDTSFTQDPSEYSPQTVVGKIEKLTAATEYRSDDAEAHEALARLWIFLYRLRAWEEVQAEAPAGTDRDSLWPLTSTIVIQRQTQQFRQSARWQDLAALRSSPVVRDHLRPALKHLILARQACPLLPDVHLLVAELCGLVADPASDAIPAENARGLAPGDPNLLFLVGQVEFQAGRIDRAYDAWRASLALSSAHEDAILALVEQRLQTPGAIEKLLPPSPRLLLRLAQGRYAAERQAAVRRLLIERAEALLEHADSPDAEACALRGATLAALQRYPQAIASYTRAVELRPREISWRYERARALQQAGRVEEAALDARWCTLADPGNSQYQALLEEINRTRLRPAGESSH